MSAYSNMVNQVTSQYSCDLANNVPLNRISGSSSIGMSGITDVSDISIHDYSAKNITINTGSCWGWGNCCCNSKGPFSSYIEDTSDPSFGDCLKSWFNQAAASNPIGLLNTCISAGSSVLSIAGTAGGFLSNISSGLGSFFKSGSSNSATETALNSYDSLLNTSNMC